AGSSIVKHRRGWRAGQRRKLDRLQSTQARGPRAGTDQHYGCTRDRRRRLITTVRFSVIAGPDPPAGGSGLASRLTLWRGQARQSMLTRVGSRPVAREDFRQSCPRVTAATAVLIRQQDERRHEDPSDKPRFEPLAHEHPLAEEWRAGNPGGDCAGETGLDESEYEITIALRNQHYSLCFPPITA